METNPNVEPDAPLFPDETSPQATPADNPQPEPAATPVSDVATEAAAAEALPEPLVEVTEQAEQPPSSEPTEGEPQVEEKTEETVSEAAVEEPATEQQAPEEENKESQSEMEFHREAEPAEVPQAEAPQPETAGPEGENQEEQEAIRPTVEAMEAVPVEGTPSETPEDALANLAAQAQTARLSPADEERAVTLLKEALLDGRAGVIRAVAALPRLPWVIGVNAVSAVWPELKPAFRSQMLAGLVRTDGDAAKRIRLSLARALFKQDVPIALKIIVGASKEMRNRETGAMSPKHAQIFANVLIGRAKPWIAQLPLADAKPNDAEILVHCALLAAFSLPHAPITQLGIIKWAAEAGRLGKLHQTVTEAIQKGLGRWSGKWQNALRKEVADLPEAFAAVLKVSPKAQQLAAPQGAITPEQAESGEAPVEAADVAPEEPDAETEVAAVALESQRVTSSEEPDAEPAEAPKAEGALEEEEEEEEEDEDEEEEEEGEEVAATEQPQPKPRPVYESKTVPRKPQQGQQAQPQQQGGKGAQALKDASIPEVLRHLEGQFQSLRSELHNTQNKLRQRDEDLRRAQKKAAERASAPIIEGEPTPEELARLNRQLEARNHELQARIEELLADSEARAVSVGAISGEAVSDPNTQLRTLLGLKIQEDYEDFLALEKESPDIVVQQHYRTVLRHVFEVLTNEGVQFDLSKSEGPQS